MTSLYVSTGVDETMWNIFTYYSLQDNPREPSKINLTSLLKFCSDIMTMNTVMVKNPLSHSDVQLIYTKTVQSAIKRARKHFERNQIVANASSSAFNLINARVENQDKLNFHDFLNALLRIAIKCYPTSADEKSAMQQLLIENIMPLAPRRYPVSIADILSDPKVQLIRKQCKEGIEQLYDYVSADGDAYTKNKNMLLSTCNYNKTKSFEDQTLEFQLMKVKSNYFVYINTLIL